MSGIINYADFDPSKLQFGNFRQNSGGKGGSVPYTYDDSPVLRIQTPTGMRLPFGVSTFPDSDPPKKTIDFDLENQEAFQAMIEQVEGAARAHAVSNGKALFNNDNVDELQVLVKCNFRSSIKKGKGPYADLFKASIEHQKGEDKVGVFVGDEHNSAVGSCADITRNSKGTAILELKSFWVVDGKLGCKWVCPQIKVYSSSKKLHEAPMMIQDGSVVTEPEPKRQKVEQDDLDAPSDEEAP